MTVAIIAAEVAAAEVAAAPRPDQPAERSAEQRRAGEAPWLQPSPAAEHADQQPAPTPTAVHTSSLAQSRLGCHVSSIATATSTPSPAKPATPTARRASSSGA